MEDRVEGRAQRTSRNARKVRGALSDLSCRAGAFVSTHARQASGLLSPSHLSHLLRIPSWRHRKCGQMDPDRGLRTDVLNGVPSDGASHSVPRASTLGVGMSRGDHPPASPSYPLRRETRLWIITQRPDREGRAGDMAAAVVGRFSIPVHQATTMRHTSRSGVRVWSQRFEHSRTHGWLVGRG